jgi:uncharacterized damage-inducible protein DinB
MNVEMTMLMNYTDWERQRWHEFLQQHSQALRTSVGPNADNRFQTVGDVIRHIFSAETRYIERLSDRPLTDATSIPSDSLEILFGFGRKGRQALREFVEAFAPGRDEGFRSVFRRFLKSESKKNCYARLSARSTALGSDCHFVPFERYANRWQPDRQDWD